MLEHAEAADERDEHADGEYPQGCRSPGLSDAEDGAAYAVAEG